MYQQFYNFSAEPFRLSPDHGFAYAHKGYSKAHAYMDYAFMRAEGFVMITGRPGTGKTTLIGALLDELANTSVSIANLVCTQLQADDLLKLVAYEFGIPVTVVEKGEILQQLTQRLKSWHRDGRRALLIVDEAQDLSVSAMEELRLLTNIQVDSRPLLQIFLLGQPELRELILSPRLEQVHQRIIAASHLKPLESDETEAYIRHRLEMVDWRGNPAISKAVYPLIYKFSEGVPRRINLICSRLLLHCAVEQRQQVAVADVREVVRELQEENLASGDSFAESDFLVADVFENDGGVTDTNNDINSGLKSDDHSNVENEDKGNPADTMKTAASCTEVVEKPEHKAGSPQNRHMESSPACVNEQPGKPGSAIPPVATVIQETRTDQQATEFTKRKGNANTKYEKRMPETLRKPVANETLKFNRGRGVRRENTSGRTTLKVKPARGGRNRRAPAGIAKTGSAQSREVDPGAGVGRKNARSRLPIVLMFLVTIILLTYGPGLGNL